MLFRTAVLIASITALAVPLAEARPRPNGEMKEVLDSLASLGPGKAAQAAKGLREGFENASAGGSGKR